jgi:hypothetical protein
LKEGKKSRSTLAVIAAVAVFGFGAGAVIDATAGQHRTAASSTSSVPSNSPEGARSASLAGLFMPEHSASLAGLFMPEKVKPAR